VSFRQGLLAARGQIAFVSALAVCTAVIIHLENLDTEERIRERVATELARGQAPASPPAASPADRAVADAALRRAEEAHGARPESPDAQAALITALSAAVQLGALEAETARPRVEALLGGAEGADAAPPPALAASLSAAAAAFPGLRERIGRIRIGG
jgi:hypothetical protein